ncbi:MAG: agmatinase [Archaeoglobaceae archaeon]|nr:agmatinase [Archaeoglobaceae archaeon]MDW7990129.1 agmatinase [Archaeoglobaceae archaeon]
MHVDSYFSISNSKIEVADYVIYGIPYDATQSFKPGSRFAPNAIREASWNLEAYSQFFSFDLSVAKICDAGNIFCDGSFEEIGTRVSDFLKKVKKIPIAMGGEHSVSILTSKKFKNTCFLVFDAHFDLRDDFDGNRFNHACTTRRIFEEGFDVLIIGVRSGCREEKDFADNKGIKYKFSWQIKCVKDILEILEGYEKFYLSIDMDVFDPSFAPGVSTPEPFGLNPSIIPPIFAEIAKKVVAMDIVEVVPDLNKITQTLAAKIIFEFISAKEKSAKIF